MGKRIPNAEIRRVWLNPNLTTAQAAREVGLTRANLWRRAKALDLPSRKLGTRYMLVDNDAVELFVEMWKAGVLGSEIASTFGMSRSAVFGWVRRLNLPRRALGSRPSISADQFREELLGRIMQRHAAGVVLRARGEFQ